MLNGRVVIPLLLRRTRLFSITRRGFTTPRITKKRKATAYVAISLC